MDTLRTELYTRVGRACPVTVELREADDHVEITLGSHRFGDAQHLVLDDPATCALLAAKCAEARDALAAHLTTRAG